MKYDLAKKLKEAGFPQRTGLNLSHYGKMTQFFTPDEGFGTHIIDEIYVPTLEELIEACGDRFYGLHVAYPNTPEVTDTDWVATAKNNIPPGYGKTPIEAVANLWLKLEEQEL